MIRVQYMPSVFRVTVSGHAGYAERGEDILCAAASMLLQTLGAAVQGLSARGFAEEVTVDLRHGQGEVCCVPVAEFRCTVRTVMDSILLGFELLARDYGEYVCLERTEEGEENVWKKK